MTPHELVHSDRGEANMRILRTALTLATLLAGAWSSALRAQCTVNPKFINIDTDSSVTVTAVCSPKADFVPGGSLQISGVASLQDTNPGQPGVGTANATLQEPAGSTVGTVDINIRKKDGSLIMMGQFVKAHTKRDGSLDLQNVPLNIPGLKNVTKSNVTSMVEHITVPGCASSITLTQSDLVSLDGTILVQSTPNPNINIIQIQSWTAQFTSKNVCGVDSGPATLTLRSTSLGASDAIVFLDTHTLTGTAYFEISTPNISQLTVVDALSGTFDPVAGTVHINFDGDNTAPVVVPAMGLWGAVILATAFVVGLFLVRRFRSAV